MDNLISIFAQDKNCVRPRFEHTRHPTKIDCASMSKHLCKIKMCEFVVFTVPVERSILQFAVSRRYPKSPEVDPMDFGTKQDSLELGPLVKRKGGWGHALNGTHGIRF